MDISILIMVFTFEISWSSNTVMWHGSANTGGSNKALTRGKSLNPLWGRNWKRVMIKLTILLLLITTTL